MSDTAHKWKLVTEYPVTEYRCGARAGESVRLRQRIVVTNHRGKPTGKVHEAGEIWVVLSGAAEPPVVLWLRQPDGERQTWDDDAGFWDWFERIEPIGSDPDGCSGN